MTAKFLVSDTQLLQDWRRTQISNRAKEM